MGYHGFRDSLFCTISSFKKTIGGGRFFSQSVESPTLSEIYADIKVDVPSINKTGSYPGKVKGDDMACPVVHVLSWKGDGYPAVIWHHISGEHPVDATCRKVLLNQKHPVNANIILIQAAYHETPAAFGMCARDLQLFARMVAISARVIDAVVDDLSEKGISSVVAGVKLGGWVANFHHAVSNSAYAYVPVLAGAGFGDIFVNSSFKGSVSSLARRNHQKVRRALNFDDLFMARGTHKNVFPVLAIHDRISDFYRQSTCYGDHKIIEFRKGHITGAKAHGKIRMVISSVTDKIKR